MSTTTTTTTPLSQTENSTSTVHPRTSITKPDIIMKNSCSDLQSRLKVRKLLGVGAAAGSKISQILGHYDHLAFQLPPNLTIWLFFNSIVFSCFTVMGLFWPSCLRLILPGDFESSMHLATSYAFLATILGLAVRSGDKNSLRLVLFGLALFHTLSFLISIWFLKKSDTKMKSLVSLILHFFCSLINIHFYHAILRSVSIPRSNQRLKSYFQSLLSFPTIETNEHDSS